MATETIGPAVAVDIVSKKFARVVGVRLTRVEKRKLREAIVGGTIDTFSLMRRRDRLLSSPSLQTMAKL